ncbi:hypothetical protein CcCBS67573_g08508 [Chytriomyces confervae]|uniref:Presenilin n=1 Tax=Chytriomyces confervae TaxID=246404 RepID=A0A507ELD9_9FUNG|nr:hypothetical protein CcCBS67573_g08508 [Chytriomyces confervae]
MGDTNVELQPMRKCSAPDCEQSAQYKCSLCTDGSAVYCSRECQLRHWTTHASTHQSPTPAPQSNPVADSNNAAQAAKPPKRSKKVRKGTLALSSLDEETIAELKYFLVQIYSIVKPVVVCITLSILCMRLTNPQGQYFDKGIGSITPSIFAGGIASAAGGGRAIAEGSQGSDATSALIIISQIVVATFIILALFHYNCMKVLYGFFGLIVLSLLGFFGFLITTSLLYIYAVPLDWISFMFFLWNFAAVGLVSVFWKGPLWLQQGYMVLMSVLMAWSLSTLSAVTSWILLALLAVWDLIAVLCPYGPLRLLIESSQKNDRAIPALLYTAGPTAMMATPPSKPVESSESISAPAATAATMNQPPTPMYIEGTSEFLQSTSNEGGSSLFNGASIQNSEALLNPNDGDGNKPSSTSQADPLVQAGPSTAGPVGAAVAADSSEDDDDGLQSGMKLGLGDFVFYSVLASRAALLDWISAANVVVAVVTGLNFTIFLLVLFRKALPALPISIVFGLLFYFVSYLTLVPLVNTVLNIPPRLNWMPVDGPGSALWAGANGGAGMVYF